MCQSGTISIGLSDHLLTYCTRKVTKGQIKEANVVKIRSLRQYSLEVLLEKLSDIDWSRVTSCNNVDEAWKIFKTIFIEILDCIAPVKEVRLKTRTEPWMSSEILENIKLCDTALYKFKKNNSDKNMYKSFCKLRNQVQRDVKLAKASYYNDKIKEHKNNPKKLWQQFKALGYSNKSCNQTKVCLKIDEELCFDPYKVAQYMNVFLRLLPQP